METFNLVNNDQERSKYRQLAVIQTDEVGRDFIEIYKSDEFLLFYRISKGIVDDTENQSELPVEALRWIKDTIVNGFWKKPSEGGLPKNQHTCINTIAGEEILIGRSMNAGMYGEAGFKIVNKSRNSYILTTRPQELQLTDKDLISTVLPIIEQCIK